MERWKVVWPGVLRALPENSSLWSLAELEEKEAAARIHQGQPFMIRPDGQVDGALTRYFNSMSFENLRLASQQSYVKDNRLFFDYLWARGKTWSDTTLDDFENWEHWRRRGAKNPRRVADGTWLRNYSAMRHLFAWASSPAIGYMVMNPLEGVQAAKGNERSKEALGEPDTRPGQRRGPNVKWLTADGVKLWRQIGLEARNADGRPDLSSRGRVADRNVAFVAMLLSSGLRLQEGASLLDVELPRQVPGKRYQWADLSPATAKGGSGRRYMIETAKLTQIRSYRDTTRAAAVARAQTRGLYEQLDGLRIVTSMRNTAGSKTVRWVEADSGLVGETPLERMKVGERLRLFRETPQGLEPLWLWLSESGAPFPPHSWCKVFESANERNQRVLGEDALFCTSKMLRHSFALTMLLLLFETVGLSPESDGDERLGEIGKGSPWLWVQMLLGHKDLETTQYVYAAPLLGVELEMLLEGHDKAAGVEVMRNLARSSPLVQDIPHG